MLVAMTYSIELFLCVVLGLMIGHAVFNIKQAVGETIDPCCAPSQDNQPLTLENGILGQSTERIPESRTPPHRAQGVCPGECATASAATATQSILNSPPSPQQPPPYVASASSMDNLAGPAAATESTSCCQ